MAPIGVLMSKNNIVTLQTVIQKKNDWHKNHLLVYISCINLLFQLYTNKLSDRPVIKKIPS